MNYSTRRSVFLYGLACFFGVACFSLALPDVMLFLKFWLALTASVFTIGLAQKTEVSGPWLHRAVWHPPMTYVISAFALWLPMFFDAAGQQYTIACIRDQDHGAILRIVRQGNGHATKDLDAECEQLVAAQFKKASLYYPSHEANIEEFDVIIEFEDGSMWRMKARIVETQPEDVLFGFTILVRNYVLVPGIASCFRRVCRNG